MDSKPKTSREALFAELFGDVDKLLLRVEALPNTISESESKIKATIEILETSSDKYRTAITEFTNQAKIELSDYLDRKTSEVTSKTTEEQRAAIQEAARLAFRSEASESAANLSLALSNATKDFKQARVSRLVEHGITAVFSSALTGLVVYLLSTY